MYVCICNAVTDKEIAKAVDQGLTSMKEITRELGVGNCCGRCVPDAKALIAERSGVQTYVPGFADSGQLVPA